MVKPSAQPSFIHLRVHSDYAIVDGLIKLPALFDRLQAQNGHAVALTDEMNLFAVVKFYKQALKHGIKPLFGADIWHETLDGDYAKLCLLCMNQQGYQNLTTLISDAYANGERKAGKVIIQRQTMTKTSLEGLIALSCAHEGELGIALLQGNQNRVKTLINHYQQWFDQDRFFIELQRLGKPVEKDYEPLALDLAEQQNMPVVATQDVRFLDETDFDAHEVRVAIHAGTTLEDPQRSKPYTAAQYLCTAESMQKRFSDVPEALANTVEIAKRCNVTLNLGNTCLPDFPVPTGITINQHLETDAEKGLETRLAELDEQYPNTLTPALKERYESRLKLELKVIEDMGFPGYFLIVADFIQWAKTHGVPVGPGRGSGAGSLVAYALAITDIDPFPYDLLFERFLNPERVSMPDFDIDFCILGRDRVIDYVANKYGRDSVSQIITYGTMAAKAVIRDVGRVMGHPYGFVDTIAKLVPNDLGMTLKKALTEEASFRARYNEEEDVKTLIDMSLKLEGTVRNVGKHAGGVVIAPSKITDFMATFCEEGSTSVVTQLDKDDVEAAGLVKFDFLGLRNLTIIDAALRTINAKRHTKNETPIDINRISLADKKTFTLLKRADTTGVFQLESRGMKELISKLKPDCFEEIIALVALFRPGPLQSGMVDDFIDRKHGRAQVNYPHTLTENILKPTYGIILYQEQVMLISQVLGGYSLGGADLLRRAMGKKKPEEMAKQRQTFIDGAINNNIDPDTATHIFDLMEKFAGYGFNKSHSAAYALIAYQTAWLKTHYPAAFMAAVLSSDMDNTDKVVIFVEDTKAMGLTLTAPDINRSQFSFTVENESNIRYGLGAIKGVGQNAIDIIIDERKTKPFQDLFDFCRRIDLRKVNRRALEALIYAGAMDDMGPNRGSLIATMETAMLAAEQYHQHQQSGQIDLFTELDTDNPTGDVSFNTHHTMSIQTLLFHEKAVLGFFYSGHPMRAYQGMLKKRHVTPLSNITPSKTKQTIHIAGIVLNARRIRTKTGKIMRILTLDDNTARVEITIFSELADQYKPLLKVDQMLMLEVSATEDKFSKGTRIVPLEITSLDACKNTLAKRLTVTINQQQAENNALDKLHQLLQNHMGGQCPVSIRYQNDTINTLLHCDETWKLQLSDRFFTTLHTLVDPSAVEVVY